MHHYGAYYCAESHFAHQMHQNATFLPLPGDKPVINFAQALYLCPAGAGGGILNKIKGCRNLWHENCKLSGTTG
ncbi:hypothetical protein BTJ39_20390 [Izhakiella australiensis]|uniref:Uncharacterized protein n=1 Tax=Izhakiella australiensis TaxID=1926881 RepID=A0A1S8YE85_9GAMM|nr:hypothetical protein BTJ39_20390 [Izhakiella australiensis]